METISRECANKISPAVTFKTNQKMAVFHQIPIVARVQKMYSLTYLGRTVSSYDEKGLKMSTVTFS